MNLIDQPARDRFAFGHDCNFSVGAPAGVGKTTAIVERICAIALADAQRMPEERILQRLVVVTYTNAAANEMRGRARARLLEAGAGTDILVQLRRAFFGTIHAYFLELVRRYGYRLGMPASVEIANDDEELWVRFRRMHPILPPDLSEQVMEDILKFIPISNIVAVAKKLDGELPRLPNLPLQPAPPVDVDPILAVKPNKRSLATITEGQRIAHAWKAEVEGGGYAPIPDYDKGSAEFKETWAAAFAPLRAWCSATSRYLALHLARSYRPYRLAEGKLTYDDVLTLAQQLVRDPETIRMLRASQPCILLDEAQDTDPTQFEVLTELARAVDSEGCWLRDNGTAGPEPGRFCMVGDPQQSIYSSRADLRTYQELHQKLCDNGGERLQFNVTMRCQNAVVDALNMTFPAVLCGSGAPGDQVRFETLRARPDAAAGQFLRVPVGVPEDFPENAKMGDRERVVAERFASWLSGLEPADLRAQNWGQVAVLCPRKKWLEVLAGPLREAGVPVQLLSTAETRADNPAYAWLTALLLTMVEPQNGFEIVGVLRDIFGISDHELACFRAEAPKVAGDESPFQINHPTVTKGPVADYLNTLHQLREKARGLSLRDAVQVVVEGTRLRERLRVLPDYGWPTLRDTLDRMQVTALQAEAERKSLHTFVEGLVQGLEEGADEPTTESNAVKMLSVHKAKGLGWDAVLLPFFCRPFRFKSDNYPQVFRRRPGELPVIAFDKHDAGADDWKEFAKTARRQESERLLYVALTRARQTVVLFDEEELFQKSKGGGFSFADLMNVTDGGQNRDQWLSLTSFPSPDPSLKPEKLACALDIPAQDPVSRSEMKKARKRAETFRRILPSSLAKHSEPEREERLGLEFPEEEAPSLDPAAYGNWWHETLEHVVRADPEAWAELFTQALERCPDHERGARELEAFRQSEAASLLAEKGIRRFAEAPFLIRRSDDEVMEGIVDCALFHVEAERWTVIDWKTDRLEDLPHQLPARYGPQLFAYAQTLRNIYGHEVRACLYSTVLGELIEVSEAVAQ